MSIMYLDELTDLLNNLAINSPNLDSIFNKIIFLMHEASESGINQLTYHFNNIDTIQTISNKLLQHFPDLYIHHTPNTNYIIIDWS